MSSNLLLGVRLDCQNQETIELSGVNLKTKVEELRIETAERVNLPKDSFELVYCGCILEDDDTLEFSGLKSGVMVHVLKKTEPEEPVPAKAITERTILQLTKTFRSFIKISALQSALYRLSQSPEVIENIISTSPGLNEDSVAIAMLQDPNLMAHFTDLDTVKRIAKMHPLLVEAAQLIATAVHEEARSNIIVSADPSIINASSTAYSYSLDNLSDDEEMAGVSLHSNSAQRNHGVDDSNSAITTIQLAAALSQAGARGFPLSASSSSASGSSGSNSGVITTEMFTQAIQQTFAPTSTSPASSATIVSPAVAQLSDLQSQLAQMHEIGLQDDAVNVQALQLANGDVQAAIEHVFSEFNEN